jgi:hypothetical protein
MIEIFLCGIKLCDLFANMSGCWLFFSLDGFFNGAVSGIMQLQELMIVLGSWCFYKFRMDWEIL